MKDVRERVEGEQRVISGQTENGDDEVVVTRKVSVVTDRTVIQCKHGTGGRG